LGIARSALHKDGGETGAKTGYDDDPQEINLLVDGCSFIMQLFNQDIKTTCIL